jgi:NarL family two-component system sensor histidine kinase LiaS
LRRRLETVERRAGIDAHLEVESLAPLSDRAEVGLYGIAQEALNNVLKHARATQVTVRIVAGPGCVELQVIDNGHGFSVDLAQTSGGIGLSSMRERARALGGTLDITSTAGHGTSIQAIIQQEESI